MTISLDYLALAATNALDNHETVKSQVKLPDGVVTHAVLSKFNNELNVKFFPKIDDAVRYQYKLVMEEDYTWIQLITLLNRKGG